MANYRQETRVVHGLPEPLEPKEAPLQGNREQVSRLPAVYLAGGWVHTGIWDLEFCAFIVSTGNEQLFTLWGLGSAIYPSTDCIYLTLIITWAFLVNELRLPLAY